MGAAVQTYEFSTGFTDLKFMRLLELGMTRGWWRKVSGFGTYCSLLARGRGCVGFRVLLPCSVVSKEVYRSLIEVFWLPVLSDM